MHDAGGRVVEGAEDCSAAGAGSSPAAAEPTVLASWTATLVRALDHRGVDAAALCRDVGIDPERLGDDGARLPLSATTRLWRLAAEVTGDDCIGLEVARHARPGTFHGLSAGVVSSGSFRDALDRIVRFGAVVCRPTGQAHLEELDDRVRFAIGWPAGAVRPSWESMEAILACIVRAGRFLHGTALSPCGVALERAERPPRSRFEAFFGCEVTYGAERYELTFPLQAARRQLPAGCDDVARTADHAVEGYLARSSAGGEVATAVRAVVSELLGTEDVTAPAVAARLAVSPRTLQRRLRDEGTTFRDVVADVRIALARRAIASGEGPVEVLATRLGFSDAAALRRAFKREVGMTPSAYALDCADGHPPSGRSAPVSPRRPAGR